MGKQMNIDFKTTAVTSKKILTQVKVKYGTL